jgi:uncharacterized protein YjiS (DUF1127 family)
MSTMIPDTRRVLVHLGHGFSMWLHRVNSRNELRNFSDRELQDIGLRRGDARAEAAKPFWMA